MLWKKPAEMRFTQLCMYVDENVPKLLEPDCPEEIKNNIYNYLWLVVKALAIKKRMFNSFEDYDGYAFYSANRLYFALKRNLENRGKIIKGKEIRPIKSCLNYMKTLLYPMKLEYLREEYNLNNTDLETSEQFDKFVYRQKVKDDIWSSQGKEDFTKAVHDILAHFNTTLDSVLAKSPFPPGSADYKKIKISILLNVLYNLKHNKPVSFEPITIILWKLPKSMGSYIKVFLKEFGTALKQEIMSSYSDSAIDDRILEYMLTNPSGEFNDHEE